MSRIIVLFVSLIFFMTSCEQKAETAKNGNIPKEEVKEEGPKIVFVNVDSLLINYDLFRERQAEFSKKEKEADDRLKYRGRQLEKELKSFYERAQSGEVARIELQKEEERLTKKQQNLMSDQERITKNLLEEGQILNEELQAGIRKILEHVKLENNYDFILSYGIGSSVLVAEERLDITDVVLEYLNANTEEKEEVQ